MCYLPYKFQDIIDKCYDVIGNLIYIILSLH